MRTFLIFTKFLETIDCVIRMFGYSTVFHLGICGRIELLHDELLLKTRKTRGGGFSRQASHVGAGGNSRPSMCRRSGRKIEKVVRFGAFWCMTCGRAFGDAQQVVVGLQP